MTGGTPLKSARGKLLSKCLIDQKKDTTFPLTEFKQRYVIT